MADKPSRPPIAPDNLQSAITLSITKPKSNLLASLNKHRTATQPKANSTITSTSTKKGFSSLTTTTATPTQTTQTQSPRQNVDTDLNFNFRLPPNAGLGFAAAPGTTSVIAKDAETRQLARKILGKNAERQRQAAREARGGKGVKRRGEDSESEEELGRSAVGRVRAGVARLGVGDRERKWEEEAAMGEGGVEVQEVGGKEGGDGGGEIAEARVVEETMGAESELKGGGEEKRKKKRRRKGKGKGGEEA